MTAAVSVWIPSYNHAPYLAAAIDSVLAQTLDGVELVIVEDGSHDGSLAIAQSYAEARPERITLLTHPGHANRGVEESARLATSRAGGRLLLGLASDDVLYPDALEHGVAVLERRPEVGFVYGYAHLIDGAGRRIPNRRTFGIDVTAGGRALERLIQGNTIPSMTALIRRECLDQAGGHDASVVYSDWDLWARIAAHWDVAFVPQALAQYRVHGRNTSWQTLAVNVGRAVEVTVALREKAPQVGGRMAETRMRALLDLQMAFLRFVTGDEAAARGDLRAAFARDPALAADVAWLGDWVWSRALDCLTPAAGLPFGAWVGEHAAPLVVPSARRAFARAAVAARHAEAACRLAMEGRSVAALRATTAAAAWDSRRAADRRFGAFLMDHVGGGVAAKVWRPAKRVLRPTR